MGFEEAEPRLGHLDGQEHVHLEQRLFEEVAHVDNIFELGRQSALREKRFVFGAKGLREEVRDFVEEVFVEGLSELLGQGAQLVFDEKQNELHLTRPGLPRRAEKTEKVQVRVEH